LKFRPLTRALEGDRQQALLSPAYTVGANLENVMGTSSTSGVQAAEATISLSSVYELGGKKSARTLVVDARAALLDSEQYSMSLSLLGGLTQQYIRVLAQQERLQIAERSVSLAEDALTVITNRIKSGATNDAELFRAKSALNQAKLELATAKVNKEIALQSLTLFWQGNYEDITLTGSLNSPAKNYSYETLFNQFLSSSNADLLIKSLDLKDAEIQLAKSDNTADLSWSVGVRRNQGAQDTSLVFGASIPLFAEKRNSGAVKSAIASKEAELLERDTKYLDVKAILFKATKSINFSSQAALHLEKEVMPDLKRALELTKEGYQKGIYTYQEWFASRDALLQSQRSLINYREATLLNEALIEQWTGQSLKSFTFNLQD
jgi:cobalt-zinc-cadmium efflux system outer membrane protein